MQSFHLIWIALVIFSLGTGVFIACEKDSDDDDDKTDDDGPSTDDDDDDDDEYHENGCTDEYPIDCDWYCCPWSHQYCCDDGDCYKYEEDCYSSDDDDDDCPPGCKNGSTCCEPPLCAGKCVGSPCC